MCKCAKLIIKSKNSVAIIYQFHTYIQIVIRKYMSRHVLSVTENLVSVSYSGLEFLRFKSDIIQTHIRPISSTAASFTKMSIVWMQLHLR